MTAPIDLESLRGILKDEQQGAQMEGPLTDEELVSLSEHCCYPDGILDRVIAELTARRARDAEAVRRQDMTTNDKLADALRNLIRAGKHLRNTVVETRGVAGMDDHDVAISDSIAALAEHDAQPAPELCGIMRTDTEYLRGLSENQNLPTLMRDTLRNAAAEIDRLHTALVAITNVPVGTVLTDHQMRMIAKNAIAT